MVNEADILKQKIKPMLVQNCIQTGFINASITEALAEKGEVFFYTEMKFNPFVDNTNIHVITGRNHLDEAYGWSRKHGDVDVAYLSGFNDYISTRIALCAWIPNIRKNGIVVITNYSESVVKGAVEHYITQVDPDSFEVEEFEDVMAGLAFITVK